MSGPGVDPSIARWAASLPRPGSVRGGTARIRALAALRSAIAEGVLPPGTPVAEQVVADTLHVSRNTLREAFRALSKEGLLEHRDHRGVVVRTLSASDVMDIYNARLVIECGALRGAARADPARLVAVQDRAQLAVAAATTPEPGASRRAGVAFHLAVVGLARSRLLDAFATRLLLQLQLVYHQTGRQPEFDASYLSRNGEIAVLVRAGKYAQSAESMYRYLRDAQAHLLTAVVAAQPG